MPRSSNSPSAGITAMSDCLSHRPSAANSRAYLSRQASSAALSVTVSDPVSASRTTVRSLSGIRSRLMSRSAMSRLLSTAWCSVTNRQRPTRRGSTRAGRPRIGLVDVDDQHMAGVGLDVVVVGDLGRTGVPDAAGRADLHARVLVAQRDIVHRAAGDRGFQRRQLDQRRPVLVGNEDVDGAVADHDAGGPVGGQVVDHLGDQVGGGRLRRPRRRHDLQAGPHLVHAGAGRAP